MLSGQVMIFRSVVWHLVRAHKAALRDEFSGRGPSRAKREFGRPFRIAIKNFAAPYVAINGHLLLAAANP